MGPWVLPNKKSCGFINYSLGKFVNPKIPLEIYEICFLFFFLFENRYGIYFLVSLEKLLVTGNMKQADRLAKHIFLKKQFPSHEQLHFDTCCASISKTVKCGLPSLTPGCARVSQKASPVLLWTWRWHRVSQPSAASSMRSLVKVHRSHKFAGKMG